MKDRRKSPYEVLKGIGIDLDAAEVPNFVDDNFRMVGKMRALVGGRPPFRFPEIDDPLARMTADMSFPRGTSEFGKIEPHSPVGQAMIMAQGAAVHSLLYLHNGLKGGLDDVESAVRIQLAVASSPNFDNVGLLSFSARRLMANVFGADRMPVATSFGVTSLPQGALLSLEAEYELL